MENQLLVRRTTRHDVALKGRMWLAPEHAGTIKYSTVALGKDGGVDIDVVDFSAGGLGVLSKVFIPRRALLRIRVESPAANVPPLLEALVRVNRVTMTDRRPAYLVGTAYEQLTEQQMSQVDHVLTLISGDDGTSAGN